MTNHPNRGRIEASDELYVVEAYDTGEIMSKPLPREKAIARCRKFNSIPAGEPRSGNYRIIKQA